MLRGDSMEHDHASTKKGISRMAAMLICCLIPIAAVILLNIIRVESTYLTFLFVLMRPIMMFAMMIMDRRDSRGSHGMSYGK